MVLEAFCGKWTISFSNTITWVEPFSSFLRGLPFLCFLKRFVILDVSFCSLVSRDCTPTFNAISEPLMRSLASAECLKTLLHPPQVRNVRFLLQRAKSLFGTCKYATGCASSRSWCLFTKALYRRCLLASSMIIESDEISLFICCKSISLEMVHVHLRHPLYSCRFPPSQILRGKCANCKFYVMVAPTVFYIFHSNGYPQQIFTSYRATQKFINVWFTIIFLILNWPSIAFFLPGCHKHFSQ